MQLSTSLGLAVGIIKFLCFIYFSNEVQTCFITWELSSILARGPHLIIRVLAGSTSTLPWSSGQNSNKISIPASAYSQNNDDFYEEYEDQPQPQTSPETELMKAPTFLSVAGQFSVTVGDTVRLPCLVDRLEGFVILWKRGAAIITVASQIIDKVTDNNIICSLFLKKVSQCL